MSQKQIDRIEQRIGGEGYSAYRKAGPGGVAICAQIGHGGPFCAFLAMQDGRFCEVLDSKRKPLRLTGWQAARGYCWRLHGSLYSRELENWIQANTLNQDADKLPPMVVTALLAWPDSHEWVDMPGGNPYGVPA